MANLTLKYKSKDMTIVLVDSLGTEIKNKVEFCDSAFINIKSNLPGKLYINDIEWMWETEQIDPNSHKRVIRYQTEESTLFENILLRIRVNGVEISKDFFYNIYVKDSLGNKSNTIRVKSVHCAPVHYSEDVTDSPGD